MNESVFQFHAGEKILHIVGMPGPDTDDCEVIRDDGGPTVLIRYQVYGKGPFYEQEKSRASLMWKRGSATSERHAAWKAALDE